jgi:hypothetical protein
MTRFAVRLIRATISFGTSCLVYLRRLALCVKAHRTPDPVPSRTGEQCGPDGAAPLCPSRFDGSGSDLGWKDRPCKRF